MPDLIKRTTQQELIAWCRVVEKAANEAVREELRRHRLLDEWIVIWRDGAPVQIPGHEIPLEWTEPGNSDEVGL